MSAITDKLHFDDHARQPETPGRIHPGWLRLCSPRQRVESEPATVDQVESAPAADSGERWMRRRTRHWAVVCLPSADSPHPVKRKSSGESRTASLFPGTVVGGWRRRPDAPAPGQGTLHRNRCLDAAGERLLDALLTASPASYGHAFPVWTAAMLQEELGLAGYRVSIHTVRRAVHRLGWEWWQDEPNGTFPREDHGFPPDLADDRLAS